MRSLGIVGGEDTEIDLPAPQPRPGLEAEFTAGRLGVRFNRPEPTFFAALRPAVEPGQDAAPPTLSPPPLVRRAVTAEPAAGHLSYTALATYGRCGYRFFAERILGLPGQEGDLGGDGVAPGAPLRLRQRRPRDARMERPPRLARARGGPVSRPPAPGAPRGDPGRSWTARARMVAGWLASELCEELGASGARLRPEMPFILPLGGSVVRGTIDLYADEAGLPLVVDYKTDALGGRTVEELVDRYGVQRSIYALAAARETQARCGPPTSSSSGPASPSSSSSTRPRSPRQGRELEELIAGHRGGALRGDPRAARGALLGLSCSCPSLLSPERADRPPAMTRLAVFAYGSLASLASAERTLGRPVEPARPGAPGRLAAALVAGARQPPCPRRPSPAPTTAPCRLTASASTSSGEAGPGPNGAADRGHRGRARPPGGARDPLRPNRGDRGDREPRTAGLRPRVHLHRQAREPRRDAASRAR